MLSVLPIIPSRISHNFYPLFLFHSHAITYYILFLLYSLNFYFVSDNEVHSLYNKICDQVKGYQKGSTDAFYPSKYYTKSINDYYVDGLSITLGNPHKLHLDQIHLLLLVITNIVSLVTLEFILMMHSIHQICYGMDMDVVMLIITAVPALTCLDSSNNFCIT